MKAHLILELLSILAKNTPHLVVCHLVEIMVFEPLSILSIVGTTAGLLSFLASTVDKLNERANDFKDCYELASLVQLPTRNMRSETQGLDSIVV